MSVFEKAIGWLAPPHCVSCGRQGSAMCKDCASYITRFGERCWRCNTLSEGSRTCDTCRRTGSPLHVYIATDHHGQARSLLSIYKFGHLRVAATPIAKIMTDAFSDYNGKKEPDYLVVPVPTATKRIRERGFGHSEMLAQQVAVNLKCEYTNALRRLGQSRQLGSRREVRLTQLSDSFAPRKKSLSGLDILLVDDVLTTGGTIISATKTLRAAGAHRVDALVFAKRL